MAGRNSRKGGEALIERPGGTALALAPWASGELTLETAPVVRSCFRLSPRARLLTGRAVVKKRGGGLTELALETLASSGAVSD